MTNVETRLTARPLYLQVRDILVQRIVEGIWKSGAALPNEVQLAQELGISTGTVRKALDLLEDERVVTRRQGRGTFVNDRASDEIGAPYTNIRDGIGHPIVGEVVRAELTRPRANAVEADRLGVREGDELIRISRLLAHRGRAYMVESCLLPEALFKSLPGDIRMYSITMLAQMNSLMVNSARESVDIVRASDSDADDLNVEEQTPLLQLDRTIFSDRGRPLEWRVARCHLRHERYVVHLN